VEQLPFDPEEFKKWPLAAQEKALELLRNRKEAPKIWYCTRGRTCDGRPHAGANYPHARSDQWPPEGVDWFAWLLMSGRGTGKTRSGAEWLRKMSQHVPRMAMIGRRGTDVRATMVEGPSGLIYVCERAGISYEWQPSKREFTFANGAKAYGYSGEEPDSLRGPQHGIAWLDEPAHMPFIEALWDNLLLGLRLDVPGGSKVLVTSTPLPVKWLKDLVADPKSRTVRVSTYKNLDNLDPNFRDNILAKYEGTRLGRQELHGEILQDVEGALWTWDLIEGGRIKPDSTIEKFAETMDRIVIGVDPAGTSRRKSDETGIIVVGKKDGELYVLADGSGRHTPERWARRAMDLYEHWSADAIIVENNYGGEMVRSVMTNIESFPRIKDVNSTRGKLIRAEPVFSLYEQGRVHHMPGLTDLETQLTEWVPGTGSSPDRMDALVHAAHELSEHARPATLSTATGNLNRGSGRSRRDTHTVARVMAPERLTRATVRSWL
jgi:phage terminase large subunit-like protein